MPAFSYSAPRFTEEDKERELSTLSEEERKNICKERKGTDNTFDENEDDLECYFSKMEEELLKIPEDDKHAYTQAMMEAPEIVKRESGFLKFLRKHSFDTVEAANSLAIYWSWRVKLFEEKAFLPMTLHGALRDDFDTLSTGIIQTLPKDVHGRAVIYHEKHLACPKLYQRNSLYRVIFYMFHVVSNDEDFQRKGFILISNTSTNRMDDIDRVYAKNMLFMTAKVAPMKLKALHGPCPDFWFIPKTIVQPVLMFVVPKELRVRINFYTCLEELEDCGISLTSIPIAMGGSFERKIESWIEEIQMEEEQTAASCP